MKILTISVAGYNIEKYIDKLMKSIEESKVIDKLEVLIINDGSMDNTIDKAKYYEKLYPNNVRLIDKKNGGHGSTINTGILNATCKYFKAIDGDDWFDSNGLKDTVFLLEKIDSDLIINDFYKIYEDDASSERITMNNLLENQTLKLEESYKKLDGLCYHNIIYRTDILKNNKIQLTEHSFYVDNEYVIYPLKYIKSIYYIPKPLYCYRLGRAGQSVSIVSLQKNIMQLQNILIKLYRWYELSVLDEERKYLVSYYIASLINFYFYVEFTFRPSTKKMNEMIKIDNVFRNNDIYRINVGRAVFLWRKNRKLFYIFIWVYFTFKRKKEKLLGDL